MTTPADLNPPSRQGVPHALLLLLALPFLLLAVDPAWLHTGIGRRDSWIYHSYFLDLPGMLRLHPDDYYSSRLAITLPGWLLHRLLPAEAASLALHLAVWYAIVLGLWRTLLAAAGPRAALLAALVAGTQGFVLVGASSNYIDGFGPAFFLLATACIAQASVSRPRLRLALAGACACALVVVNILFVLLLPLLALFALVMVRHRLSGAAWAAAGGLAAFAAFALASKSLGGRWHFLAPSLAFASSGAAQAAIQSDKLRVREWLPQAGYLVLPAAAGLGALLSLAFRRPARAGAFFQFQALALLALLAAMQRLPSFSLLQWWFYPVALLFPASRLALGAQWRGLLDGLPPRAFAAACL
ncbi:MAG: hypothetical protein K2W96_22810, partial [Gemmataceae bacterium]|nr:hypothetical protein [Gemmataceae bacterium]